MRLPSPYAALLLLLASSSTPALGQDHDVMTQKGFGRAVAVSGTDLMVGEPSNERVPGRVYLFRRDPQSGRWDRSAILSSPRAAPGDGFGAGLAAGPGILVVTATGGGTQAVYTFQESPEGGWGAAGVLDPSARGVGGRLLGPVALAGSRLHLLVEGDGGSVQLASFARVGDGWGNPRTVSLDIPVPVDAVLTMTASEERLPAGAPTYEDGEIVIYEAAGTGAATFRELVGTSLGASTFDGDASLGSVAAAEGGIVIMGAPTRFFGYGGAFVFERDDTSGAWTLAQTLEPELVSGYPSMLGADNPCEEGAAGGFSCLNVDVRSFLSLESLGLEPGMQVNDVWGWTDAETGKEYALVGAVDRTIFIDVSDPNRPAVLGSLAATPGTRANWWRDVKVYRSYAYIVADNVGNHGLQVFDLTQLRDVQGPPVEFEPTAHYAGFADAHNLFINEETGFAYVVGINGGGRTCGGGLHVLDLSDPVDPRFVGCFAHLGTGESRQGYSHDTQCVVYHGPDGRFAGREICVSANETAISIADVTDKDDMVAVGLGEYPNSSYAHQGWLSGDHRFFYQNDETDEVNGLTEGTRMLIWDLAQLDDPVLAAEYVSENRASDHNYYVSGSYVYQSNYLAGLRVLDISDPENPVEVGFFDTAPWGEDRPGFGGSWSNYPFFESGLILVTSMEEGLFLLKRSNMIS